MRNRARTLALLAVLALGTTPVLTACGSANESGDDTSVVSQEPDQSDNGSSNDTDNLNYQPPSNTTWTELAGRKDGNVYVYTSPGGSPAVDRLPLGTKVQVQCWVPNTTGMASADPGLYMFQWKGETRFAITNVFANGDPLGQPGTTNIDPKVKKCLTK